MHDACCKFFNRCSLPCPPAHCDKVGMYNILVCSPSPDDAMVGRWGRVNPVMRLKEPLPMGDPPTTMPSSIRGSPLTTKRRFKSSVTFWKSVTRLSS